jgi:hypothetical protein
MFGFQLKVFDPCSRSSDLGLAADNRAIFKLRNKSHIVERSGENAALTSKNSVVGERFDEVSCHSGAARNKLSKSVAEFACSRNRYWNRRDKGEFDNQP